MPVSVHTLIEASRGTIIVTSAPNDGASCSSNLNLSLVC